MNIRLTDSKKRFYLMAAVAGILLLMAAYKFLSPVVAGLFPGREAIAVKEKKLSQYIEKIQDKKSLEAQLAALRQNLQRAEAGLLSGKTEALAAVEVQKILADIASKNGADITSMRIVGGQQPDGAVYQAVPVQVAIGSDIRQIVNILHAIDSSPKILRTADVSIRSAGLRQDDKILTTLTVEGYMKPVSNQ